MARMNKALFNIIIGLSLLSSFTVQAQPMPVGDNGLSARYPFVATVFNRIFNNTPLDSFYEKLYTLKTTGTGVVSVVHIGDSHIQADFLSGIVRNGLQEFFGNAGRGLVFPYQLALSNAPADIGSSSGTRWDFNRIAHPELPVTPGISGFGLASTASAPDLHLFLRPGAGDFDRLTFFLDSNAIHAYTIQADNSDTTYIISNARTDSTAWPSLVLDKKTTGFGMTGIPSTGSKAFYGVSLENSGPGVLYHTIGVNGARYDQFNDADLFWRQLPALKADLYIISLGTNEAQRAAFAGTVFEQDLSGFLQRLKQTSPGAAVLITTAPDSYKGRSANKVLQQLNQSLVAYCNRNYLPLWDLYRITNGYGSAYSWARRGLMSRDRIHFTSEGYRLQGNLLFSALAKGYNDYIQIH